MNAEQNKTILIVDTLAGNLFSIKAAIERLGFSTEILSAPPQLNKAPQENISTTYAGIVIPGQGRFGTVLKNLRANNWLDFLQQAREESLPMLGICVGMQIFFESSEEDNNVDGFSWFKGKTQALNFPKKPMVGWAKLDSQIWSDSTVYFVNSYAIKQSELSIANTTYGEQFVAAIRQGSFTGVQFHPEKSAEAGAAIILEALSYYSENIVPQRYDAKNSDSLSKRSQNSDSQSNGIQANASQTNSAGDKQ